jgi:crotonobetainyl-CoA:carnitine CoA-transferase CaiB-like acyl-CoA transferase
LHRDPRFKKNADRVRNRDVLIPLLAEVFSKRTVNAWIAALEPAGVPVGGINNLQQVFDHPQVKARNMKVDVPHPLSGTVPLVASPIKMSLTPPQFTQAPPLLGEHTGQVLKEILSLPDNELATLRAAGVVS